MHNLKELTLRECKNLKYVLPSTVCTSLFQLEKLSIGSCDDIEEVVAIKEEAGSEVVSSNVSLLFPKLKYLTLEDLPKLKQFCRGDSVEFPLLSKLTIYECYEMSVFIDASSINEKQPLFSHKVIFLIL